MPHIKLVAVDLDGTLLGPDERISPRDRNAVVRVRDAGAQVVLVTARSFQRAQPFALELGLRAPVLCCGGALVADSESGRPLLHLPVPVGPGLGVLNYALSEHLLLVAHCNGSYLAQMETIAAHADVASLVQPAWRPVRDLAPYVRDGATFLRALGRHSVDALRARFEARGVAELRFVELVWRGLPDLGIYDARVSKGATLHAFCTERGIAREAVMAIGDNVSDGSMFGVAGVRVAMGNADGELKAAADYVTATNAEGGVAQALAHFFGW